MTNPCPQCGYEDWDAYNDSQENCWRLFCRICGFDEHKDSHIHRLEHGKEEEE